MYHPSICARRAAALEAQFQVSLRPHAPEEVEYWVARLSDARDEKGTPLRSLAPEEERFITNELLLTKVDFRYAASRYFHVTKKQRGVGPMYPLLESQEFVLGRIAELEAGTGERGDGILVNVLKAARQVGVSSLMEALIAHRVTTQNEVLGLIASDVPETSAYLFDILERIVEKLPWWLRPAETDHVKNTEIAFEGGSHVWVGSGKSTRGTTGQRGQLARGKTISVAHLSELSTWDNPDQIDDAFLPAVPRSPHVLAGLESTAKGRGNWWHKHWKGSADGDTRFSNIFIPWYVEGSYSRPAPEGWSPSTDTLSHAARCEATAPLWTGRSYSLTRDQLYWYESTRAYYGKKDKLSTFLEEFGAADDDECFQFSVPAVFSTEVLDRVQAQLRPLAARYEVVEWKEMR